MILSSPYDHGSSAHGTTGHDLSLRRHRLAALRAVLTTQGLDGFFVPRADEHQGEYVPPAAERLAWISGFTGSAGQALVLRDRAALFVDGRYTLQARQEAAPELFEYRHLTDDPQAIWLADALPQGGRIGFDPRLHTQSWLEKNQAALERIGVILVACGENPLDAVWQDPPPPPMAPVMVHDLAYAGRSSAEKRADIAAALARAGAGAMVLTQPDSIAWLLNIRGGDLPCTPVTLGFAVLDDEGRVTLCIAPEKLGPDVCAHLGPDVTVRPRDALAEVLADLGRSGRPVRIDPESAGVWVFHQVRATGGIIHRGPDLCMLPKACKNAVELEGARSAHVRDGVALVRFLHWLETAAADGELLESTAAERLLAFRQQGVRFHGVSFETISAAGANGAIVHYRVRPDSAHRLQPGNLYLVDSGGQYDDGTTDVTRTVAIGSPTAEMRERYTYVLKGHIALARVRFPQGITGSQLDCLARVPLWSLGLDYDHGTGHGVGSFLCVHEGPQRISKLPNNIALMAGMIISNEPGYYKAGDYGIRIENLMAVVPCPGFHHAERPLLMFEPLTLVPLDRTLILPEALNTEEISWINTYHARIAASILPFLADDTTTWLTQATRPLAIPATVYG